jgi:hypothetical protein
MGVTGKYMLEKGLVSDRCGEYKIPSYLRTSIVYLENKCWILVFRRKNISCSECMMHIQSRLRQDWPSNRITECRTRDFDRQKSFQYKRVAVLGARKDWFMDGEMTGGGYGREARTKQTNDCS